MILKIINSKENPPLPHVVQLLVGFRVIVMNDVETIVSQYRQNFEIVLNIHDTIDHDGLFDELRGIGVKFNVNNNNQDDSH